MRRRVFGQNNQRGRPITTDAYARPHFPRRGKIGISKAAVDCWHGGSGGRAADLPAG